MMQARNHDPQTSRETHQSRTHRGVVDRALDVAIGGTALVAEKAIETVERTTERASERLDTARTRIEEASRDIRGRIVEDEDHRRYEDRTRDELYQLAAERDIPSRSTMRKAELIEALRSER